MAPLVEVPEPDSSNFLVISIITISDERKSALEAAVRSALSVKHSRDGASRTGKQPMFAYRHGQPPKQKERSQAHDDALRSQSCVADVYQAARVAIDAGWQELAIFDAYSLRQLENRMRDGEEKELSLVLIGLRQNPFKDTTSATPDDTMKVVAVRRACAEIVPNLASKNPEIKLTAFSDGVDEEDSSWYFETLWFSRGICLHNPANPMFADDDAQSKAIDNALNKPPFLPMEIKDEIMTNLDQELSLDQLTAMPDKDSFQPKRIEIHVLAPVSTDDLKQLQESVESEAKIIDPNISVLLHEWKGAEPATRRELCRLWDRYCQKTRTDYGRYAFNFLYPDLWNENAELGLAQRMGGPIPVKVRKVGIDTAALTWKAIPKSDDSALEEYFCRTPTDPEEDAEGELLLPLDRPFYKDRRPWQNVQNFTTAPPAFYLTSRFTTEENHALVTTMKTIDEDVGDYVSDDASEEEKKFSFVAWEGEEDATTEDMWRLFKECIQYRGPGDTVGQIICIDRQSFEDKTVLLVDYIWNGAQWNPGEGEYDESMPDDEFYKIKGMKWGRVEAIQASISWINLDIANMGFEDFVDRGDTQVYIAPEVLDRR